MTDCRTNTCGSLGKEEKMIHANFTYDGISCDEYGVIIAQFNGIENGKTGISQETGLSSVQAARGDEFHIISQKYTSPLTFEIQLFRTDFKDITQQHERALKKWLMQKGKYKWFTILDERYEGIWFKANIHSPDNIRINDVAAISFQVTCNASYAYSDLIEQKFTFTDNIRTVSFYVDNDENSVLYPDMEITMLTDGDLEIRNSADENKSSFQITGLKSGEHILVRAEIPVIKSSEDTAQYNVYNRFSKYWFFIADGQNTISVSNNCSLILRYREKRRVGAQ